MSLERLKEVRDSFLAALEQAAGDADALENTCLKWEADQSDLGHEERVK